MHGAEEFVADVLGRMKLGQEVDRATLDRLVDICVSALDSAPEDARAYPLFLKAARGLIDYSPEDIEERLDVYYVQSRLVEKILGHQYEFLGMPEQDVLRANALLKDFMANIVGRIIPDYKPRPAYLNVPPPLVPPEKGFIGFNPKAVSDPEIRLEWEKRIEENSLNELLNNEQDYLSIQRQKFESWISRFVEETEGTGSHRNRDGGDAVATPR